MPITIDLPPELERRLREAAAREQRPPEEFARAVLEERLGGAPPEPPSGLAALMDQWLAEGPDLEEARRAIPRRSSPCACGRLPLSREPLVPAVTSSGPPAAPGCPPA